MRSLMVDIGSTFIKWICHSNEYRKDTATRVPFPPPSLHEPPFFEVAPDDIWRAILLAIRQSEPVDRIYISVQMHGYLLGDLSGLAITPYISWQDERANLPANSSTYLKKYPNIIEPWFGTSLKANLPAVSLFAMQGLYPDIVRRSRVFFTLGSYLAFRLTGNNCTHLSDAAPSGFFDARTGLPNSLAPAWLQMPRTVDICQPIGFYQGIAVYSPIGDQQASVLGSGLTPDSYLLNLGTAAQLCTVSDTTIYGNFESRPYLDGKTLCTVTRLIGGREIMRMIDDAQLENMLTDNYRQALEKLPVRGNLLVAGGAANHYRNLIERVCINLNIPYTIKTDKDALDGLIKLIKGDEKHAVS